MTVKEGDTMRRDESSGNYASGHDVHDRDVENDEHDAPKKSWIGRYMDDLSKSDPELNYAPVVLPWRIGLFLLTSTIVQSLSYTAVSSLNNPHGTWTMKQSQQFSSLVYEMLYLGPVFGLCIDLTRIFGERFRPVIIIACAINAIAGFVAFGCNRVPSEYGSCLMLSWLIEVMVMFMYIPMNSVVINYGNRVVESPGETSARIGGLMAQAMVWRSTGNFIEQIFENLGHGVYPKYHFQLRWFGLIMAIGSCVLIVQALFLTKRAYYTDYRKVSLKGSEPVRFYKNVAGIGKKALSNKAESPGLKLMFILCFNFIYLMIPDALTGTRYSFNSHWSGQFSVGLKQTNAILGNLAAVLGALAYALWMYFAQRSESTNGRLYRANPFVILLVATAVWIFGIFFHFIGEMGSTNPHFSYKVFLQFETIVVGACLRFTFMPTLSLAAMHAVRFYESTTFQLYSVSTSGAGVVCYPVTTSFMQSLGVTTLKGYWKALLLFMVLRCVPLLIAASLPKFRDDETIPAIADHNEPLNEMDSDHPAKGTQHDESDKLEHREN
ncbi:hypothetical protein ABL78_4365 [Leptomonas seymouri]|uniref:Folate/biopterin transporter n=1 Tax=Leptomonas seymouri TaxID=5684 RepID=A0A0N1HYC7_LEPSE|nr:hypothetical protein ABL78_4365 [Leptomonas seymouri]|eukprot:KPI86590.1 hypothetical protein ABL78_4365 [Leptomonas seymouri]